MKDERIKFVFFEKRSTKGVLKLKKYVRAFLIRKKGLWSTQLYSKAYMSQLSEITPNDHVLFFSIKKLKDLAIMQQEMKGMSLNAYLWDPVAFGCKSWFSQQAYAFFSHRIPNFHFFTFDPDDARKYRFELLPQVYRRPDPRLLETKVKYNVFYIGQDKGRAAMLSKIAGKLKEADLSCQFYLVKERKGTAVRELSHFYHDTYLDYETMLQYCAEADCILELLQKGQSGPTLRTMDALFLQKKLITTNTHAVDFKFYHPNNIMVISPDDTTAEELKEFFCKPYQPVNPALLDSHVITNVIKQFM